MVVVVVNSPPTRPGGNSGARSFMINAPRSAILILKAGLDQNLCLEENVFSKLEISIQLLLLYELLQLDSKQYLFL